MSPLDCVQWEGKGGSGAAVLFFSAPSRFALNHTNFSSAASKSGTAAAEESETGPVSLGTKARGLLGALRPAYWQVSVCRCALRVQAGSCCLLLRQAPAGMNACANSNPVPWSAVPTWQALAVVAVLYVGRFDATFALLRAKGVSWGAV